MFVLPPKYCPTILRAATTWTDKTDVMYNAVSAGAVDVLSKPISVQKLRNIYQHLVRKDVTRPGSNATDPTRGSAAPSLTLAESARAGASTPVGTMSYFQSDAKEQLASGMTAKVPGSEQKVAAVQSMMNARRMSPMEEVGACANTGHAERCAATQIRRC